LDDVYEERLAGSGWIRLIMELGLAF